MKDLVVDLLIENAMESFVGCCRHRDDKKLSVGRPEEKPKSPSLFVSFSVD